MHPQNNVFPQTYQGGESDRGISFRDYIAIKAMQGLLASDTDTDWSAEQVADLAYLQADALIVQSNQKK